MSPAGRLKLASTARNADKYNPKLVLLILTISIFDFGRTSSVGNSVRGVKTTSVYDSYYDENFMYSGFDSKMYSEALPADGEIKEKIIPVRGFELAKFTSDIKEEENEVSGDGGIAKTTGTADRGVEDESGDNRNKVKEMISDVVKGEVKTYCSTFESKCRCSADGKELICKGAGFVEVPSSLPSTLTKL